ncbi:MAG: hypothetical protein A3G66_02880 [Candidatus Levybacteria bacterium RIFCSPLOWO2_12_FULL_39_17]|nr:MAG: hypothetical protein A3G66_02880 [Candidatus Levybacteria bacterium RIFCSPLOWO2_12_FULL_39_17]
MNERMRGGEMDIFDSLEEANESREKLFAGEIPVERASEFLVSEREVDRIAGQVKDVAEWVVAFGSDGALYARDLAEGGESKLIEAGRLQLSVSLSPPTKEESYLLHIFANSKEGMINLTFGLYEDFELEIRRLAENEDYFSSSPLDLMTLGEHAVIKKCLDEASQNIPAAV